MESSHVLYITDSSAYLAQCHGRDPATVAPLVEAQEPHCAHLPRTPEDLRSLAEQLGTRLRSDHPEGLVCRLVIPSSWCLVHFIRLDTDKWNEQTALFEFEQYLPVDLDELTCVLQRHGRNAALVVAVFTEALRSFFDELDRHAVHVEAATVDVTLIEPGEQPGSGAVLLDTQREVYVSFSDGDPAITAACAMTRHAEDETNPDLLHRTAAEAGLGRTHEHWQLYCLIGDGDNARSAADDANATSPVTLLPPEQTVAAICHAATAPQVCDLRQDQLAYSGRWETLRTQGLRTAVALAVLLIALSLGFRIQNHTYGRAIGELRSQKQALYATVYPGESVPPSAALRLRSERIKLEGLTNGTKQTAMPGSEHGLHTLALMSDLVRQIPSQVRLRLDELSADDRGMKLVGGTRAHSDAGLLVQAFNELDALAADPPRTKKNKDSTVGFRVQIRRTGDAETH